MNIRLYRKFCVKLFREILEFVHKVIYLAFYVTLENTKVDQLFRIAPSSHRALRHN